MPVVQVHHKQEVAIRQLPRFTENGGYACQLPRSAANGRLRVLAVQAHHDGVEDVPHFFDVDETRACKNVFNGAVFSRDTELR